MDSIRIAQSCARDAAQAVAEFYAAVVQPRMALVVFFCSCEYDLDALAEQMNRLFHGVLVAGCTSAGEIGPDGYRGHSLTGASFSADSFVAVGGLLDGLSRFDIATGNELAQTLLQRLESKASDASSDNSFALMLIDGLSVREEPVADALQHALGKVPLFGGSASDDLEFGKTLVFGDGSFKSDRAQLILISTALPFRVFKAQHFASGSERMVVTEADPKRRIVREINGLPAAVEYARLIGVDVSELDPELFSASPLAVKIGGMDYMRSIQKANPDGSLTFYCAIEEGLVLRIAHGVDMISNLEQTFGEIDAQIGQPSLVLACDCILRNVEASRQDIKQRISDIFARNHVVGFSSFGEQYLGVHVNQTLTGVAIGQAQDTESQHV